jgi:hypothetical protein
LQVFLQLEDAKVDIERRRDLREPVQRRARAPRGDVRALHRSRALGRGVDGVEVGLQDAKKNGGLVHLRLFPEPGGVLRWGITAAGHVLFWKTGLGSE